MGSLYKAFLDEHKIDITDCDNFIETGTYYGGTTFELEPYFKNVYTIESIKHIHDEVKRRYTGSKIKFYLGDSSVMLKDVLKEVNGKSLFFLDGHFSGGDSEGFKEIPLYEELEQIMVYHKGEAIVIIDDCRLIGTSFSNWAYISVDDMKNIVSARLTKSYFLPVNGTKDDRLVLHLRSY